MGLKDLLFGGRGDASAQQLKRQEDKEKAEAARLKAEAEAKAKAAAELEAARKKAKATCDVTPTNPAGICMKAGGSVKGWGKASKGKKARYF